MSDSLEKVKKWSVDADIRVDYTENGARASFWNNKPVSREIIKKTIIALLLIPPTFFLYWYHFVEIAAVVVVIVVGLILLSIGELVYYAAFSSPRFTRFYLKRITKKPTCKVVIHNPDHEVKYTTNSLGCVLDIEYDDSVRSKLVTASLVGRKLQSQEVKELTILLDGKAEGELVIKEY